MYTILANSEVGVELGKTLEPIMNSISSAVSVSDIVSLLGTAVAFGIPFFLAWMGVRKLVKITTSAVRSGKISA